MGNKRCYEDVWGVGRITADNVKVVYAMTPGNSYGRSRTRSLRHVALFVAFALASLGTAVVSSSPAHACSPIPQFSLEVRHLEAASSLADLNDPNGALAMEFAAWAAAFGFLSGDMDPLTGAQLSTSVAVIGIPDGVFGNGGGVSAYDTVWGAPPLNVAPWAVPVDTITSCGGVFGPAPVGTSTWRVDSSSLRFGPAEDRAEVTQELDRIFGTGSQVAIDLAAEGQLLKGVIRDGLDQLGERGDGSQGLGTLQVFDRATGVTTTSDEWIMPRCRGVFPTVFLSLDEVPTSGADVIFGTDNADVIVAAGGDDIVCGRGGNDTIYGGEGNDVIEGNDGKDRIRGQNGNDRLVGGAGNDNLNGNNGNDVVLGGTGHDYVSGRAGQDLVSGGAGNDVVNGGADADTLYGGAGNDTVSGNAGADVIVGGTGNDWLSGGDGSDLLLGEGGHDQLFGARGNDRLWGGSGQDYCAGGNGVDREVNCEASF